MPNQRSQGKKMVGCYLTEDRIERLKDLAADRGINLTDLLSYIADEGMEILGDPAEFMDRKRDARDGLSRSN